VYLPSIGYCMMVGHLCTVLAEAKPAMVCCNPHLFPFPFPSSLCLALFNSVHFEPMFAQMLHFHFPLCQTTNQVQPQAQSARTEQASDQSKQQLADANDNKQTASNAAREQEEYVSLISFVSFGSILHLSIVAVILALLAQKCVDRNHEWRDAYTLWSAAYKGEWMTT
jgi:hypothetical protein